MNNTTVEKPTIKAVDNPWYLLATLYGRSMESDEDLEARNRTAWNRYMAATLMDDQRASLIEKGFRNAEDLMPFSPEELSNIKKAFSERHQQVGSTARTEIPPPEQINFSNVSFGHYFRVRGFFFPCSGADFTGAIFHNHADFESVAFSGWASFEGAIFHNHADFEGVAFSDWASFRGAIYYNRANFENATFSGPTSFTGAVFSDKVNFRGVAFSDASLFVNANIAGPTSFESATFRHSPPLFFNAKLHEGTVWRGVKWPNPPKDAGEAGKFVDAYERLKLEMDRLKKHEDELDFFALELQSRRVLNGNWGGIPIALYGFLCNYGRNYARPLYGLLITAAVGVLPFWWHFVLWNFWQSVVPSNFWQAVGISIANTLGVLGFRKDFVDPQVIESLPGSLKVFSAMQTVAGILLLFLFGLAIRNRFRMK